MDFYNLESRVDNCATTRMFNTMETKFDGMFKDVWGKINNELVEKEYMD